MKKVKILVVDDDDSLRCALRDTLEIAGYNVAESEHGEAALTRLLLEPDIKLVISDVQMKPVDGLALLDSIRESHLDLPVILMTAFGTVNKAVAALHHGAADYLAKPFELSDLLEKVEGLLSHSIERRDQFIAEDPIMQELMAMAERVAKTDTTVMISGPSGAGKEVVARHVHACSPRAKRAFVAINCAAIPENMLEAVLFGYEKGAFTGAYKSTPGKFELAQGGTLLLDEISEMELGLQAKLLRVLQEREVERLGGNQTILLDVRILATTNRDLKGEVAEGNFREDLFYRLNVFPLRLPPLNARVNDVPLLSQYFVEKYCPPNEKRTLTADALTKLGEYDWPGNVRELDNVMQRALILSNSQSIQAGDILFEESFNSDATHPVDSGNALSSNLRNREQEMILDALRSNGGSRKAAAEALGISPRTLRYKLSRMREEGVAVPGHGTAAA
ncbi:MAG: sigma-54 dependent transcriptional regulator [Pseudomonadota bacterium]